MKKYILVILVAFMIFSGCSPRKNTSQLPEASSEPIQSSSISSSESTSSKSENSEIPNNESEQPSDTISVLPESQSNDTSSVSSSSTAPAQAIIEPTIETVFIELSSNSINKDKISNSLQIPYKIHNNSSKDVNTGPDYVIEKYNGTDWSAFPFSELEQPNWPSVIIPIPKDSVVDGNLTYWDFEDDMLPGTYRLVKHVSEEGKDYLIIYAKFSVTE